MLAKQLTAWQPMSLPTELPGFGFNLKSVRGIILFAVSPVCDNTFSMLFNNLNYIKNFGCYHIKKGRKEPIFKILLSICLSDSKMILWKWSLGDILHKVSKPFWLFEKHGNKATSEKGQNSKTLKFKNSIIMEVLLCFYENCLEVLLLWSSIWFV